MFIITTVRKDSRRTVAAIGKQLKGY